MQFHLIGIGGIGMSALARILLQRGFSVSGSDVQPSPTLDLLSQMGAKIYMRHASQNVPKDAICVYNSMIKEDHPEYIAAKKPLWHRSELLRFLGEGRKILAVTGTHGKTTTTSLLVSVLKRAGLDPSYAIGGILLDGSLNGGDGKGDYFVVEADESDASFLNYPVFGAIVTNIDGDHLDFFGTEEALDDAFVKFMKGVQSKEHLFWCRDNARLLKLAEEGISYGFRSHANLLGSNVRQIGWKTLFDAGSIQDIELALVGGHLALNALAVFGLARSLGVDVKVIRAVFKDFAGVARRCERKNLRDDVLILDDYGHHPTEIKTTLAAVRSAIAKRRLIAVFQPHRYSRTKLCLEQFPTAFEACDEVIVTDIYGAFEKPQLGLHATSVVEEFKKQSSTPCRYVAKDHLKEELLNIIRPLDVVLMFNAGDLTKLSAEVGHHFS